MTRILNVEGPNRVVLDVYLDTCVYRAEVRDAEENIIAGARSANLDGDDSVLEMIAAYFTGHKDHVTGGVLVENARAELKASGVDARPSVPGWRLTEIVADALAGRTALVMPADVRLTPEQATEVAAVVAMAIKRRMDIRERT